MRSVLAAIVLVWTVLPVTAHAATESEIKFVAKEMACLCGTCPRRPLDECNCGYAGQQREEIGRLLDEGNGKQAIIDRFVSRAGLEVLAVPPAEGFNISAWVMPFAVLFAGGFVVLIVIRTWSRGKEARQQVASAAQAPSDDDPYRARLEADLRERDV